jgi:hypothetical protein
MNLETLARETAERWLRHKLEYPEFADRDLHAAIARALHAATEPLRAEIARLNERPEPEAEPEAVAAALAMVDADAGEVFNAVIWTAAAPTVIELRRKHESNSETAARILAAEVRRLRADRDATRESLRR